VVLAPGSYPPIWLAKRIETLAHGLVPARGDTVVFEGKASLPFPTTVVSNTNHRVSRAVSNERWSGGANTSLRFLGY